MKSLAIFLFSVCFISSGSEKLCLAETAGAVSGSEPECGQMLKECFNSEDLQRSNCFYTTSKHPFCEGTELGGLIYERWTLSASTTVGGQTPPGLLGPSIYDAACISNCDNRWLGEIVSARQDGTTVKQIRSYLNACKKENQLEILRP